MNVCRWDLHETTLYTDTLFSGNIHYGTYNLRQCLWLCHCSVDFHHEMYIKESQGESQSHQKTLQLDRVTGIDHCCQFIEESFSPDSVHGGSVIFLQFCFPFRSYAFFGQLFIAFFFFSHASHAVSLCWSITVAQTEIS